MVLFLFFFFKQKTAYEMRISDWSSDVCSSDLLLGAENIVEHQISVTVELFGLSARDRRAFVPTAVHHRVQPGEDARGGLAPGRVKIGHFIPSSGVCTLRRAQAAASAVRYPTVSSWHSSPVTGGLSTQAGTR